jgi:purine-binding chemotaxis protein CheW
MTPSEQKFLVFSLQGNLFALELCHIAEVCDLPTLSPLPLAPDCFLGVINFHGDIVAVLDLAAPLKLSEQSSHGKVVILHQEVASLALLADTTVKIIPGEDVCSEPQSDSPYISALLHTSCGIVQLLNLEHLTHYAQTLLSGSKD